jgi:hypothetical protein
VLFSFDPVDEIRTRVTATHERLDEPRMVEEWRLYWDRWLEAVDEG